MIEKISIRVADFVKIHSPKEISNDQYEIIQYMVHVMILNISKGLIVLTIAYFLHILAL